MMIYYSLLGTISALGGAKTVWVTMINLAFVTPW